MNMQPFYLAIGLVSPVILPPRHGLTLDGLLGGVIHEFHNHEPGWERRLMDLPLKKTMVEDRPLYHASIGHISWNSKLQNLIFTSRFLEPALHDEMFYRKPGKRLPQVMSGSGTYRNRMTDYQSRAADYIWFHGVGDMEKIYDLLHLVPGIGARRHTGAGEIGRLSNGNPDISFFPAEDVNEETFGLVDHKGYPARPIPECVWSQISNTRMPGAMATWHNPYRDRMNASNCVVPPMNARIYREEDDPKNRIPT